MKRGTLLLASTAALLLLLLLLLSDPSWLPDQYQALPMSSRQALRDVAAVLLGSCLGLLVAWWFQVRASKQLSEVEDALVRRLERQIASLEELSQEQNEVTRNQQTQMQRDYEWFQTSTGSAKALASVAGRVLLGAGEDLSYTRFDHADLIGVSIAQRRLDHASFFGTDLQASSWVDCSMLSCRFDGNLTVASFTQCQLDGSSFWPQAKGSDVRVSGGSMREIHHRGRLHFLINGLEDLPEWRLFPGAKLRLENRSAPGREERRERGTSAKALKPVLLRNWVVEGSGYEDFMYTNGDELDRVIGGERIAIRLDNGAFIAKGCIFYGCTIMIGDLWPPGTVDSVFQSCLFIDSTVVTDPDEAWSRASPEFVDCLYLARLSEGAPHPGIPEWESLPFGARWAWWQRLWGRESMLDDEAGLTES